MIFLVILQNLDWMKLPQWISYHVCQIKEIPRVTRVGVISYESTVIVQ